MLTTRRALSFPWAALRSTVAAFLCVPSKDAQAVCFAVGILLWKQTQKADMSLGDSGPTGSWNGSAKPIYFEINAIIRAFFTLLFGSDAHDEAGGYATSPR
jgi:hypothetical protein